VDVQAMLQTMDADARLQFPEDVAPVDPDVAEAVIAFGDALARGDSGAIGEMLDQPSKNVLDSLVNADQWSEATEGIEAVRVVLVSDSVGSGTSRATPAFDLDSTVDRIVEIESQLEAFLEANGLPADDTNAIVRAGLAAGLLSQDEGSDESRAIQEMWDLMRQAASAGQLRDLLEAVSRAKGENVADEQLDMATRALEPMLLGAIGGGSLDVAYAIQGQDGAYVLGWSMSQAFGSYVFGMTPVTLQVRRFASDWDGAQSWDLAPTGFASGTGFSSVANAGDSGGASAREPERGETPPPANTPRRKNTPGGPITIPGG